MTTVPADLRWRLDPLRAELMEAAAFVAGSDGRAPWALFGSTVMMLHGIRERIGDVDVFVAPAIWEHLAGRLAWRVRLPHPTDPAILERRVGGFRVHAFYTWTPRDPWVDAAAARERAELVDGWWCAPLDEIRKHKAGAWADRPDTTHAKHAADVKAIDAYLEAARA